MNCSKCKGLGRYYAEIFPGCTQISVCQCKASEAARALLKAEFERDHYHNLKRIREARERLGIAK